MDEHKMLKQIVRRWEAAGQWVDRGRWTRAKNGTPAYRPTRREIPAKCRLLRSLGGRGAAKRAPRGGEFSVMTTAGI